MNTIIVAYNKNFIIGNKGLMPWHISNDLKFFKETTEGHACVMGRKTWESIPVVYRPLKGRTNIIVSSSSFIGCLKVDSLVVSVNDAFEALRIADFLTDHKEVFITGGSQLYTYCLENNLVDRVLASEIKGYANVEGDTFFPNLKALGWQGKVFREFDEFTVMEYKKS